MGTKIGVFDEKRVGREKKSDILVIKFQLFTNVAAELSRGARFFGGLRSNPLT